MTDHVPEPSESARLESDPIRTTLALVLAGLILGGLGFRSCQARNPWKPGRPTEQFGAGFRRGFIPDFWIKQGEPMTLGARAVPLGPDGCGGPAVHVAFAGDDRATVDAFYRAALAAGARDNVAPGLRPNYHPSYYGAFVLDPDGYNIEAVCHKAE